MTRKRPPAWAKGCDVHVYSAARLDFAMKEKKQDPNDPKDPGCTSSELSRVAGYRSHSYINRMRRGVPGSRSIDPVRAERIARYLGVELDWLFVAESVKSLDRKSAA